MVRLEIETAEEEPYIGPIMLIGSSGDTVHITTNQYGLGWGYLKPGSDYSLSVGEFLHFTRFKTSSTLGQEQSLSLRLPPSKLKGKLVQHGKGLFLIRYIGADGKPKRAEELWAISTTTKKRYGTMTDGYGIGRIEVPAGDSYTLHAVGYPAFEKHTFPPSSEGKLESVEIDFDLSKGKNSAGQKPTKREGDKVDNSSAKEKQGKSDPNTNYFQPKRSVTSTQTQERQNPRLAGGGMTHQDSVEVARVRLKRNRQRISRASFAIPPRPVKPSPVVSKRVVEGIYMLRDEFIEADRQDPNFRNSMQLEVLRPLLRTNWQNVVFVVDVTCSMDAFMEEYLLWFILARNAEKVRGCVFFNDGDGCADSLKRLGNTGGVRYCTPELSVIADTLLASISYGCSGDIEENDLEALLIGQMFFPEAQSLVLVADNASAVRDLELLDMLEKPVHVFLCGQTLAQGELPPHPDYLTIAHRTGGSIHTLEQDLAFRKESDPSPQVSLRGYEYRYLKGRYELVKR